MKKLPKTSGYLISILLLLPLGSYAQNVAVETDSLKWRSFMAFNIGADVIAGVKTIVQDNQDWLNFFVDAEFYRFTINAEYGRQSRTFDNGTDVYQTSGSYFRAGPDVNFLFKDPDRSSLFIGARYSMNTFSDELEYTLPNLFWGDQRNKLENNNLSGKWVELVGGIKVKLFQKVWMGYTGRFKFAADTFENETLIPSYIPGYGRADLRSTWEFNYWIIIRLPFRKANTPVRVNFN